MFLYQDWMPRQTKTSQSDQNVSVRPKPSVLWPDAIVGLYGTAKRSVGSAYLEDLRDSSGNEMNSAQHPLSRKWSMLKWCNVFYKPSCLWPYSETSSEGQWLHPHLTSCSNVPSTRCGGHRQLCCHPARCPAETRHPVPAGGSSLCWSAGAATLLPTLKEAFSRNNLASLSIKLVMFVS